MKRLLSLGLAMAFFFSLLLLPGCGKNTTGATADKGEVSSSGLSGGSAIHENLSQLIPGKQVEVERVRQYGTAQTYTSLEGALTVRVEYPTGDYAALDELIIHWIETTANDYRTAFEAQGKSGAFNATYDSYIVNERVVSVRVTGAVSHSHTSRPEQVSAIFNFDCYTGELLALDTLLPDSDETALQNVVQQPLDAWLLTPQALRLYHQDGSASDFTYEQLAGMLTLPLIPPPKQSNTIDPDKPMIALTFDDGPYTKVTKRLLDVLEEYNGRATFFVVGERIEEFQDILRRTVEEGHEIAIHTWSHPNLTRLSVDEIRKQVMDTYNAVLETAGYTCAAVRPPGGNHNETVRNTIGELGLYLANWSVDTRDWESRDADSVYKKVMNGVRDGAIILCHDLYPSTAEAMERAIPELIEQGYQLVTLTELLTYKYGEVEPGKLYTSAY